MRFSRQLPAASHGRSRESRGAKPLWPSQNGWKHPLMPNLEQLSSPFECAYREIVERYKALQARCVFKKSDADFMP